MTSITHQQAQTYLQIATDRVLVAEEQAALALHLENCAQCQSYARDLGDLESLLRRAMKNRWNVTPPPLTLDRPLASQTRAAFQRLLPVAGLPVLVTAILFTAILLTKGWRSSNNATNTPLATVTAMLAPTPGTQSSDTAVSIADCTPESYTVQSGDTLETIAQKYGLPREAIIESNPLKTENLKAGETLVIPSCRPTPSLTPTTTLTFTVTPPILLTSRTP